MDKERRRALLRDRPQSSDEKPKETVATPRPDSRYLTGKLPEPSNEEWEAWCEHPVTRFVATAYEQIALRSRDNWLAAAWNGGVADQKTLDVARSYADAYAAFTANTRSNFSEYATPTKT